MKPPADDLDRLMAVMNTAFDPTFGEAWTRRQVEDAAPTHRGGRRALVARYRAHHGLGH